MPENLNIDHTKVRQRAQQLENHANACEQQAIKLDIQAQRTGVEKYAADAKEQRQKAASLRADAAQLRESYSESLELNQLFEKERNRRFGRRDAQH